MIPTHPKAWFAGNVDLLYTTGEFIPPKKQILSSAMRQILIVQIKEQMKWKIKKSLLAQCEL